MEQGESSGEHYERVFYSPYNEHRYCTALRSIDTVRALHQTVVSLRTALDESRQEIEKLRKQISINTEIQDARQCQHPPPAVDANQQIDYKALGEKVSELEKIYYKAHPKVDSQSSSYAKQQPQTSASVLQSDEIRKDKKNVSIVPDIKISTQNLSDSNISATGVSGNSNNQQMASRIDVKIKVSSNINVGDNDTSTECSESSSDTQEQQQKTSRSENRNEKEDEDEIKSEKGAEQSQAAEDDASDILKRENPKVEVEMYEDSNTNTFNVDAKNLKIKVTSEESINVRKSVERISVQQSSTEYLNLDIDELSEGDNSVFTEGATTPIEQRLQQVEDIGSDNEGEVDEGGELLREEREETDDIPEEVDDIELIFSSDDNKEMIQEDLVSISEYEPWQEPGGTGTPVLTKFSTITSDDVDREAYYQKKKALKAARLRGKEGNVQFKDKSLESTDSLSFDNNNRSMDYKSSSLEKDSSIENPISRDNSIDTFTKPLKGGGVAGKKWTNVNVLIETDISKVGIGDENIIDMGRRNTCPNPPIYRPLGSSQNRSSFRSPLAAKYPRNHLPLTGTKSLKGTETGAISKNGDLKCTSAVQTDISALPHQWRSETQLIGSDYCLSGFTLPSKYSTPQGNSRSGKSSLRFSEKTQEARRVLLSDINFTSMVPELSRSADHLCQQKINEEEADEDTEYFKGNLLKTPDYRGITPSASTPGVSQWTVNESTTQTEGFWNNRGDSFDSSKSYSLRSGNSTSLLNKHHRSRSVPSIRCAICKQNHNTMKPSESMHYATPSTTKAVKFREPLHKSRGSLPDLRHDCHCPRRYGDSCSKTILYRMHESSGSTESLLEEADDFLRHCPEDSTDATSKRNNRRCSEADIHRDYYPSKQSLPFLPKSPKCLKPGQLAKVISKGGRIVVGRIRYVGPVAGSDENEIFVGLQLPHALGDSDGSFCGKKFFESETNFAIFVPYKKVVMAWN